MSVVPDDDLRFVDLPGRRTADPLADRGEVASSVRIVRLERTEGRTAHRHPHSEEVIHVVSGNGVVWIDGETTPVGPGDTVLVPPNAAHATIPDRGVEMKLVCFFPHPDLAANTEDTELIVTDTNGANP